MWQPKDSVEFYLHQALAMIERHPNEPCWQEERDKWLGVLDAITEREQP